MGDGEQTELAPSETETSSARAWGLADDVDDLPTQRITPSRITTAAVLASLAVVAMAGAVVFHHLHKTSPAGPALVQASAAPVVVPTPKPQLPLLNGTYRIFHDWANATYRNNERKGGGTVHWDNSDMAPYKSFVISTACAEACIATAQPLDDHGKLIAGDPFVMRLDGGTWRDIAPMHWEQPCTLITTGEVVGNATQSERTDFVPQLDGSFHGTQTTTVETDACGDKGDTEVTQLTMTRIGDA